MNQAVKNRQNILKQIELVLHNHLMILVEQLAPPLDTLQAKLVQVSTDSKQYDEIAEQLE